MPETDRPLTPEERQEAARLCAEMPMGPMEHYLRRVIRRALATITALERNLADETQARLTEVEHWVERYRLNDEWRQQTSQLLAKETQKRATAYAEGLDDAIAAVRRVKGATLPDAYSEDPDVIHMSYAVIAIEALRDTPAPAPTGEEKP